MFACVGIGAAGNNIADEFAKLGYPSIAVNFSKTDLDSLINVKNRLHLIGSEGVGKQRNEAIRLMQNNWESTVDFITQNFSQPSIEIILIAFSTSGGTGSGLSPFVIEILKEKMTDKIIVGCPILPDNYEVIGSQINNQEASEELSELDICVLPIDNQSLLRNLNKKIPKNILYEEINNKFVQLIHQIDSYTNKFSKNGIVDKRDVIQLFSTSGVMSIIDTQIADFTNFKLDSKSFNEKIQRSWKKSNIFAPIQFERVLRAGIIFDGDEKIMEYLHYDKLFDTFSHAPIDLFEGYYHDGDGKVLTILSGLNWYYNRIEEVDTIIEKHKNSLSSVSEKVYKSKNTSKMHLFDSISNKPTATSNNSRSVTDILSKYAR
ncbi:cell division protein FtsZ [Cytobacillus praedii]|uniref:Cell division protein FtsZ n=1 Tax=Cytobacillus praedii TaxID=1742358 RepID=A0A4R1ATQ3_9BACI|nr:cell division protein FtsZ [Cytobacillus praedii]TCJ00970.1 cell division protein FtsZ [Cytobacillus praedii]